MNNLEEFKEHILTCYPQEGCGLVVEDTFIPLANIAENPVDSFLMESGTYITYEHRIQCILHSHTFIATDFDPRTPSHEDLKLAKATALPMGIVHTDGKVITDIIYFNTKEPADLLDRPYIPGAYDCYTLARDYLIKERGFFLDVLPRPMDWQKWDDSYMLANLDNQGLVKVPVGQELKEGDVVVFRISSTVPNHVGIYIGNDKMYHHLNRRLSLEDSFSKWYRQVYATYRLL